MPADWLLAVIAVLFLTHVALLAAVIKRGNQRAERTREQDGTLDCPRCETANEPDYRYCRECVAELPAGRAVSRDPAESRSQRPF